MLKIKLLFALFFLSITCAFTQDSGVYSIPFTLDRKLLIFKGKLNGVESDFAFDTGAAICAADSNHEKSKAVVKVENKQTAILDGNGKIGFTKMATTNTLTIGGFNVENVDAILLDNMPFLNCFNLYLLGSNVIKNFNWEIDFESQTLRVSKNAFPTNESMAIIPISYKHNLPYTKLIINKKKYKHILIDLGYSGTIEMPNDDKNGKKILDEKNKNHLSQQSIAAAYAALGISQSNKTQEIILDSLQINNQSYYKINTVFNQNNDFKMGINFFKSNCKKLIINNTESNYYLEKKLNTDTVLSTKNLSMVLKDNQIKIIGFRLYEDETLNKFTINEVVKSVNGKTVNDFKGECDFLEWILFVKKEKVIIEKMNGDKVIIDK